MRIKLMIICESLGGGVRKHILDILNNIDLEIYDVGVIHGNRYDGIFEEAIENLSLKGIKFYKIKELQRELSFNLDLISLLKTIRILAAYKPDIVHCHSSKAGGIGRLASKIKGVKKIIYTPHAYMFQDASLNSIKRNIYVLLEKILAFFTDTTVNVSNGERENALSKKIINLDNSIVIYNGIARPNIENSLNKKGKIVIGTAARLDDQKDPWTFFNIASQVVSKNNNTEFVYIGDGKYKDEIQKEISTRGLNDSIKLMGYRNDVDMLIPQFDIYLITSLYEGLPYSIVEAISIGLPVVATNVDGNNEIVFDNHNGLLFNAKNVEEGVRCIENLVNDEELRKKFGHCSKEIFEQKFTLDQMMESLYKLYGTQIRSNEIQQLISE